MTSSINSVSLRPGQSGLQRSCQRWHELEIGQRRVECDTSIRPALGASPYVSCSMPWHQKGGGFQEIKYRLSASLESSSFPVFRLSDVALQYHEGHCLNEPVGTYYVDDSVSAVPAPFTIY